MAGFNPERKEEITAMSELKHLLARLEAKKKSGYSDVVYWKSVKSEERLLRNMADALEDADIPRNAFFKEVVITGLPVYDGLPPEGKLCFEWCKRYMLSENKQTWLPVAKPESIDSDTADINNQGQDNEDATSITDSGDAASAAVTGSDTATNTDETNVNANTGTSTGTVADDDDAGSASEEKKLPAYEYNVNGESMTEVLKGADVGTA
ncbi:hypothetical protein L1O59_004426, partial [Salmonella enterica]|nr:hypothetical protein [Salmonella enterica]